jgi:hypothetical protein
MSYYIAHRTDETGLRCMRCGCALPPFTEAQLQSAKALGYNPEQMRAAVWPPHFQLFYSSELRILVVQNNVPHNALIFPCSPQ